MAALYGGHDIESFPSLCLQLALSLVSASAGSFFLWDEFQNEFILKAAQGPYRERAHVKLREGISVPLIMNQKLLGLLNISERDTLEPFSESDHQHIQSLSNHMAAAYTRLKYQTQLQTENKHLHEMLAQIKQDQKGNESFIQLGKLAANLTHELNNPMDAIRRYVGLALDKASAEDTLTREYLGKARKAIRRAIRIIHSLLELAASSKNPVRLVEVHDLILQSLEVLEDPSFQNIQIKKNFCGTPSYLLDHGISMVLSNLYHNACHAMNGAGLLTITTHHSEHTLSIWVEDTGCGVKPAVQKRLFENFFSTKNQGEGTGIGLALCRDIVERCGGTIRCDEDSQSGARFILTLPCQNKAE